jgi:hydrogenase-4 component B
VTLFLVGLALLLAAGVSACVSRRASPARSLYQWLSIAGCVAAAADAARVLASGTPLTGALPSTLPGGEWRLELDPLAAVFVLTVMTVGGACAVFGTHDRRAEDGDARPSGVSQLAFAVLLAAIALVFTAASVVAFLGAWEIMAISSYVLIVTNHRQADVRRAGLIYLVATHTATLALFAMFAAWASAGSASDWTFASLAAASPQLSRGTVAGILLLALFGFGFKAGCVPLHFWLPPAHAAAPSHVSALMSGIVIKTGIYGLFRVVLMLGGAPAWWGWLIFAIGVASGVLGVLWALAQHDSKRLLAYHSVENIGIILIGMGVGVLGVAAGSPPVAFLGFASGLLHTVNHALFKSLLFLGAGAVYRATGTRNMEELGGLARRMPLTWLAFVVGAAAIIGVPPFNGFVSEWLAYQAMFLGADMRSGASAGGGPLRVLLLGIPALALIGALALACFAKVAGVVFLGSPRGEEAARASEARTGAIAPMVALAVICVGLGVVPPLGIALVNPAARALTRAPEAGVPAAVASGAWVLALLALAAIAAVALLWWLRARLSRETRRSDVTWGCGYGPVTPRMQYTASSFAAPLLATFSRLSGLRVTRSRGVLHTRPVDLVLDELAMPLWRKMHRAAMRLRVAQQGSLHIYLLYVMAALLAMLAYLALAPW